MIQIKRLSQRGEEFVPITLAEAVVVNVDGLGGIFPKIAPFAVKTEDDPQHFVTTLDKLLGVLGIDFSDFKEQLAQKQDKLKAGNGITIQNGVISTNLNTTLYKVVSAEQFSVLKPSAELMNTIYMVPKHIDGNALTNGNVCVEYVCLELEDTDGSKSYHWEQLGEVSTTIDTSNLLTKQDYFLIGIFAEPVTTSKKEPVGVTYSIPNNLYDDMVITNEADMIDVYEQITTN